MKNNKKGFTLVELLAVIVILALIMSIAIVSIGGILTSARQSTFKETAATIIHGVRQQLTLANRLPTAATGEVTKYYGFSSKILDKDPELPLGGRIAYNTNGTAIGSGAVTELTGTPSCGASGVSYVKVKYTASSMQHEFSICLMTTDSNPFINEATEAAILDNNNTTMITTR